MQHQLILYNLITMMTKRHIHFRIKLIKRRDFPRYKKYGSTSCIIICSAHAVYNNNDDNMHLNLFCQNQLGYQVHA